MKHADFIVYYTTSYVESGIEHAEYFIIKYVVVIIQVRAQLCVFVAGDLVNPTFDSQTKETLMTPAQEFSDSLSLTERFYKEVIQYRYRTDIRWGTCIILTPTDYTPTYILQWYCITISVIGPMETTS